MRRAPWPLEKGPLSNSENSDFLVTIYAARHGRVAEAARRARR